MLRTPCRGGCVSSWLEERNLPHKESIRNIPSRFSFEIPPELLHMSHHFRYSPESRQVQSPAALRICARSGHSARARGWLARLAGALRRLRIVGGIGIVLGYSRDEPAGGERLQVCLHRVSNIVGIDLRSSALGIDWRYHRVRAAQVFAMKSSRS